MTKLKLACERNHHLIRLTFASRQHQGVYKAMLSYGFKNNSVTSKILLHKTGCWNHRVVSTEYLTVCLIRQRGERGWSKPVPVAVWLNHGCWVGCEEEYSSQMRVGLDRQGRGWSKAVPVAVWLNYGGLGWLRSAIFISDAGWTGPSKFGGQSRSSGVDDHQTLKSYNQTLNGAAPSLILQPTNETCGEWPQNRSATNDSFELAPSQKLLDCIQSNPSNHQPNTR